MQYEFFRKQNYTSSLHSLALEYKQEQDQQSQPCKASPMKLKSPDLRITSFFFSYETEISRKKNLVCNLEFLWSNFAKFFCEVKLEFFSLDF